MMHRNTKLKVQSLRLLPYYYDARKHKIKSTVTETVAILAELKPFKGSGALVPHRPGNILSTRLEISYLAIEIYFLRHVMAHAVSCPSLTTETWLVPGQSK